MLFASPNDFQQDTDFALPLFHDSLGCIQQEDKMRDKPGFEHLNEPLHVLVEAELPASVIDAQLSHAREILEELLKPVVRYIANCDVDAGFANTKFLSCN